MAADGDGWRDVLGSGAVLTREVRAGDGAGPEFKQLVHVHYAMRVPGAAEPFMDTRELPGGEPVQLTIGDQILERVVPGLMLAVKMMSPGAIFDVRIDSRFGYADEGLPPHVKPGEDLEARVELVAIGEFEKEPVEMTPRELAAAIRVAKERGNEFFREKKLNKALRCYQDGLKKSESHLPPAAQPEEDVPPAKDEYNQDPEIIQLRIETAGNIAACLEQQGRLKECKETCVAVLAQDPTNLKALLRAARVATKQGEFVEARTCLKHANEAHPSSPLVAREAAALKKRVAEYQAKRKVQFGGQLQVDEMATTERPQRDGSPRDSSPPGPAAAQAEGSNYLHVSGGAGTLDAPASELPPGTPAARPALPFLKVLRNLLLLLAPTLLAVMAMALGPARAAAMATSEAPRAVTTPRWRQAHKDSAQQELNKVGYESLVCEGRAQRASCCVCLQAMTQAELRQRKVEGTYPGRRVDYGFRMDGQKRVIPFHQSEEALSAILEKVCQRLPIEIPKSEREDKIPAVRRAITRACSSMIDNHFDELIAAWQRADFAEAAQGLNLDRELAPETVPQRLCRHTVGVCEPRESWVEVLLSLGPGYEDTPCMLCREAIATAVKAGASLESLRSPAAMCSSLSLSAPASETRIALVSQAFGQSCLDFLYNNRGTLAAQIADDQGATCAAMLSSKLCDNLCTMVDPSN